MPFGLKNTGATYQRMMQDCLKKQIGRNAQVYVDDIVVTTKREETLLDDLRETFANLHRFISKLGENALLFYRLMKKADKFKWTPEVEDALKNLKWLLTTPPILVAPREKEPLYLYVSTTN